MLETPCLPSAQKLHSSYSWIYVTNRPSTLDSCCRIPLLEARVSCLRRSIFSGTLVEGVHAPVILLFWCRLLPGRPDQIGHCWMFFWTPSLILFSSLRWHTCCPVSLPRIRRREFETEISWTLTSLFSGALYYDSDGNGGRIIKVFE